MGGSAPFIDVLFQKFVDYIRIEAYHQVHIRRLGLMNVYVVLKNRKSINYIGILPWNAVKAVYSSEIVGLLKIRKLSPAKRVSSSPTNVLFHGVKPFFAHSWILAYPIIIMCSIFPNFQW